MRNTKKVRSQSTRHSHIVRIRGVCGGSPVIKGTRTPVRSIVQYHQSVGYTPSEIVAHLPHLTLAQVHSALAYYYDHKKEIDEEIRLNNDEQAWKRYVDNKLSRMKKLATAGTR